MDRINNPTRGKHRSGPEPKCHDFQISRSGLDREGKPTKHSTRAIERQGKKGSHPRLPGRCGWWWGKGYRDTWDWVGRSPHQLPLSILILRSQKYYGGVGGREEGFVNTPGWSQHRTLWTLARDGDVSGRAGRREMEWLSNGLGLVASVSQAWLQCLLSCCCRPVSKNTFS